MLLSALVNEHRARLNDSGVSGGPLNDAALERHVRIAVTAMALEKRPRRVSGSLTLVANQSDYDAPATIAKLVNVDWLSNCQPWNDQSGSIPHWELVETDTGEKIRFTPAPTTQQASALGDINFTYYANHVYTPAGADFDITTLKDDDKDLLLLRASVEAMRELSVRSARKPTTINAGQSLPGNLTESSLYQKFLNEWKAAA